METINFKISVELNLSQATKDFILSVFKGIIAQPAIAEAPKPKQKPAIAEAPKQEQKPATSTTQAPASEISIEDVRKALSLKVNNHRAEIKDKLNEFGAPSVTKLDPANYQEMLDFLNSLD